MNAAPQPARRPDASADEARGAAGDADELARGLAGAAGNGNRLDRAELARLTALAGRSLKSAGTKAVASGRWAAEMTLAMADHVAVRDLSTLRAHHGGAEGADLAERIIGSAARSAAVVGAAAGAMATLSETTPATWAALPVELVVETLVVVAIEMKLVAELHAAAGLPFTGPVAQRGAGIARSWATRRGLTASVTSPLAAAELLGLSARRQLTEQLRRRLTRRAGRNMVAWTPFLAGAAAAAYLNRRATRSVGEEIARSLGLVRGRGWHRSRPGAATITLPPDAARALDAARPAIPPPPPAPTAAPGTAPAPPPPPAPSVEAERADGPAGMQRTAHAVPPVPPPPPVPDPGARAQTRGGR